MEKKLKNAIIMNRLTKIMFVLGFLLTSVWSYSSNSVYAQNQKFSFEFKQTSIKTIFQYIEKHSEFIFMYRTDLLDTSKKVSVKVEKQSIEQILEQVLKGTSVVYEINDRQIVLKKGLERLEEVPQQSRQKKLIQGLVGSVRKLNFDSFLHWLRYTGNKSWKPSEYYHYITRRCQKLRGSCGYSIRNRTEKGQYGRFGAIYTTGRSESSCV